MPSTLRGEPTSVLADIEMITGEAVILAVPPAPLGLRILAAVIDVAVLIGWQLVFYIGLSSFLDGASSALVDALATMITIFTFVIWPAGFETLSGGRSPGKLVCGTRVVRDDGGPITLRHALARALLGIAELYAFGAVPAFVSAAVSGRYQRLGDRLAGTYVVRARIAWTPPRVTAMPAQLRDWAAAADLERVPAAEIGWCRQFLGRRETIAPAAHAVAARDLVLRIAPWILPAPPQASDEDILAAVLAERYRRELARSRADAALTARLFPGGLS